MHVSFAVVQFAEWHCLMSIELNVLRRGGTKCLSQQRMHLTSCAADLNKKKQGTISTSGLGGFGEHPMSHQEPVNEVKTLRMRFVGSFFSLCLSGLVQKTPVTDTAYMDVFIRWRSQTGLPCLIIIVKAKDIHNDRQTRSREQKNSNGHAKAISRGAIIM